MNRYHVRLEVREPAFELRIGPRTEPFLAGYDVYAANPDDAARRAIAKFKSDAALSGVGWQREIERVIVGDDPVPARVWSAEGGFETEAASPASAPEVAAPAAALTETPTEVVSPPAEAPTEPEPLATEPQETVLAPASWSMVQTIAVLAGVGLGFYLGVKAARLRDAA